MLLQIKNNLAPEGKAFVFELNSISGFSWIGQDEYEIEDLLLQRAKNDSKLDRAE